MSARFITALLASLLTLISSVADAAYVITFNSQPGDSIGQGRQLTSTGTIDAVAYSRNGITLRFSEGASTWQLDFAPPAGQLLAVGTYALAEKFSSGSPSRPGMEVFGEGRRCNSLSGNFRVLEVSYFYGLVQQLALEFEQHCEGMAPALFGKVRYGSSVPLGGNDLFAAAGSDQQVEEGATVTLDGSGSSDSGGGTLAYRWTQIFGPALTLSSPTAARTSFTAPAVSPGGQDFIFELSVTNNAGSSKTDRVAVHVADLADPKTFIRFDSQPGDWIGQGLSRVYGRADGEISAQFIGGLFIQFNGGLTYWDMYFAAFGGPLVPGTYLFAEGLSSVNHSILDVNGSGRGCRIVQGRFTVLEIEVTAGNLNKVAIDFEQHCEGVVPALFGGIRINSALAYVPPVAATVATQLQYASSDKFVIRRGTFSGGMQARALNAQGLPVPGARVTFSMTASCGGLLDATSVLADANGLVTGPSFLADSALGACHVTATLPGNVSPLDFTWIVYAPSDGGVLQDLWWSGTAENGWGMSIIQHGDVLFANVYVYDSAGKPMWLVIPGGAWNAGRTAFTGALYIPHGSPFYAYDVSRFNIGPTVGSATFTFSGENNAVFDYTINGVAGRKNISRLSFGRPELVAAPSLGDLWWGGQSQNGWGITVLQQVRTLFSLWFTYDADGAPTWYVMPGGDWTASDTYEGRIYRAVGSAWVGSTYDPTQHRTIDVGSYRLRFTGGAATFDYTIDGRSGTLPLTRLTF